MGGGAERREKKVVFAFEKQGMANKLTFFEPKMPFFGPKRYFLPTFFRTFVLYGRAIDFNFWVVPSL